MARTPPAPPPPEPVAPLEPADEVPSPEPPVIGEPVMVEAVEPTPAHAAEQRSRAKSRTGQQVFSGTMLVTVGVWWFRLKGYDLNPLPDLEEIPGEVAAAIGGL